MTLTHPHIKKIIQDAQDQIRKLTGNQAVFISIINHEGKYFEFAQLADIICDVTGVPFAEAILKNRSTLPRRTRQLIAFYAYECCTKNNSQIAELLGGRDHTTIISGRQVIKDLIDSGDPLVCQFVELINVKLGLINEINGHGA